MHKQNRVNDANDHPRKRQRKNEVGAEDKPNLGDTKDENVQSAAVNDNIFKNLTFFILQAGGLTKARCDIFRNQIFKHGGQHEKNRTPNITHMIIDDKMDYEKLCKILKVEAPPPNVKIVKSMWLSMCIKQKELVPTNGFEVQMNASNVKEKNMSAISIAGDQSKDSTKEEKTCSNNVPASGTCHVDKYKKDAVLNAQGEGDDESDYMPSDGEEDCRNSDDMIKESSTSSFRPTSVSPRKLPKGNWVCAQSSLQKTYNANQHITEKLEQLAKTYQSTNDRWRAMTYQKAVAALKRYDKEITSWEQAKAIPGIGASLADKIWEIVESGELRKLNELSSAGDIATLNLFTNIWGAGPTTARAWVQQGMRSLEDLKTKANLTRQQKVGLKYYDELLDRMPREEAAEIEATVKEAALSIQSGLIAMACGSYRRGKKTCGDVDVLITHPDGHSHKGVFNKLLVKLKDQGFLTDDLVSHEEVGNQKKYLGVCKLPGAGRKKTGYHCCSS
ncbi:DNA polymerase lambda isoform X2 [Lingula anatina]|uniref:DNA polymerase n=1 Tax=Lingula anatina TaxID=7574 RepID=A0A1S3KHL6_LINAN|nr:DNA polymerase lambda isoform X2 [Lingula anatina]|eukprot:XP_013421997.1 DNA polymerase lambda isoform X2 [Lingula anatina]